MADYRRRQGDKPRWAPELGFRGIAAALLGLAGMILRTVEHAVQRLPHQPFSIAAFALCALAFAMATTGLALAIEGPGLFRLVPYPRRRLL